MASSTRHSETVKVYRTPEGGMYHSATQELITQLYKEPDGDSLFMDAACTKLMVVEERPTTIPSVSQPINIPVPTTSQTSSTLYSETEKYTKHDAWSKRETLFLIDEMKTYVQEEDNPPTTFAELNARIKRGKANQKHLFTEIALKLSEAFKMEFTVKQVTRKWQTLIDGFKAAVDNNTSTGKGRSRFQFLDEMNALIGDRDDINFLVTADSQSVVVHRSHTPTPDSSRASSSSTPDLPETELDIDRDGTDNDERRKEKQTLSRPVQSRERARKDNDVLEFLKKSEEKSEKREKEILDEMKNFHKSFLETMQKMAEKM